VKAGSAGSAAARPGYAIEPGCRWALYQAVKDVGTEFRLGEDVLVLREESWLCLPPLTPSAVCNQKGYLGGHPAASSAVAVAGVTGKPGRQKA
jgi:hypothetical protein